MTQAQASLARIQTGAYTPDSAARSFQFEDGSALVLVDGAWIDVRPGSAFYDRDTQEQATLLKVNDRSILFEDAAGDVSTLNVVEFFARYAR